MNEQTIEALLNTAAAPRHYSPGELVFCQGDPAEAFYYLKAGLTQAFCVMPDGAKRNIMTTWPGAFFGTSTFFEQAPRRSSEIVREESLVYVITRDIYAALTASEPAFTDVVLQSLAADVGILQEQLVDSALLDVNVNVARFLCRRLESTPGTDTVHFSQDFIANTLGLSRWAVNKALMHFKAMGWLDTGYGRIRVLLPDELRRFAYQ